MMTIKKSLQYYNHIIYSVLAMGLVLSPATLANNKGKIDNIQEKLLRIQSELNNAIEERDTARGQAEKINKERVNARMKMIATARQIQQAESSLSSHEKRLRELRIQYNGQVQTFKEKYHHLTGALAAIEKLSQNP